MTSSHVKSLSVFVPISIVILAVVVPAIYFANTVHVLVLGMWPHSLTAPLYRSPILSVTWMESPARFEESYLAQYDIIIIQDVPSYLLSGKFTSLLVDQVGTGKGLVLFGGPFSLGSGGYNDSEISVVLPVVCTSGDFREEKADLNRTNDHEILQNVEVSSLSVQGYNALKQKGGSSALAVDYYTKLPMIVVGNYGKGRVAVIAFSNVLTGASMFDRVLSNLLRWLAPQPFFTAEVDFTFVQVGLAAMIVAFPISFFRRRLPK